MVFNWSWRGMKNTRLDSIQVPYLELSRNRVYANQPYPGTLEPKIEMYHSCMLVDSASTSLLEGITMSTGFK